MLDLTFRCLDELRDYHRELRAEGQGTADLAALTPLVIAALEPTLHLLLRLLLLLLLLLLPLLLLSYSDCQTPAQPTVLSYPIQPVRYDQFEDPSELALLWSSSRTWHCLTSKPGWCIIGWRPVGMFLKRALLLSSLTRSSHFPNSLSGWQLSAIRTNSDRWPMSTAWPGSESRLGAKGQLSAGPDLD